MLSWVAVHLAVAISALDGDESSRRELDVNYSDQCKNLATKYGKKQRKRMKKYDRMHCPLQMRLCLPCGSVRFNLRPQ